MDTKQANKVFPPSDWITVNQALQLYPLARTTLYKLVENGILPAYRPSRKITLFKRTEIEKMLEESRKTDSELLKEIVYNRKF